MRRIIIFGDLHNATQRLRNIQNAYKNTIFFSVGDLSSKFDRGFPTPSKELYFIRGNHDLFIDNKPDITGKAYRVMKKLIYVPSPSVMNFDGLTIGFLGGVLSPKHINEKYLVLTKHSAYYTYPMMQRMFNKKLDILITHDIPYYNSIKTGSQFIEILIYKTKPKYHFAGHLHKFVRERIFNTDSFSLPIYGYAEIYNNLLSIHDKNGGIIYQQYIDLMEVRK